MEITPEEPVGLANRANPFQQKDHCAASFKWITVQPHLTSQLDTTTYAKCSVIILPPS